MKDIKVLWVEEETNTNLESRKDALEGCLLYDIEYINNYDLAKKEISKNHSIYKVIILDILIPKNEGLLNLSNYGTELVKLLIEKDATDRLMIYTNEVWERFDKTLKTPDIEKIYLQKNHCRNDEMFLEFIKKIAKKNE